MEFRILYAAAGSQTRPSWLPVVANKLARRDSIQFSALLFTSIGKTFMVWYILHVVITLLWGGVRLRRMLEDDKTIEVLLLRQQLLVLRCHQKRGPLISPGEKFILITLAEQVCRFGRAQKGQLERLFLIFKPETLLRWLQHLVKKKWTFANTSTARGRPPIDPDLVPLILQLARENQ
jgi:hypothetical protein